MWRTNIIFSVLLFNMFVKINGQDERCFSPSNTYGLCVILPKCPSLQSLYDGNQRDYQMINYIETARRNCGSRQYGDSPIVCCQDPIITIKYPAGSLFQLQAEKPIRKPIQHSPVIRPPTYNTNLQPTGKSCRDPNGLNGVCMNIKECSSVLSEFVARFDDSKYHEFIKRSNRYCDNIRPFICCPNDGKSEEPLNGEHVGIQNGSKTRNKIQGRFLTPEEGCGYSNATHLRIIGPHRATIGAWPWIALLGYENKFGEKSWECAGSLITTRHVLSSAFCVISTLSLARLGEYDISSTADGDVQDIKIIRSIAHPDYDRRDGTSDIAVLYLEHDAQLSLNVLPICMPISETIKSQSFTNYNPFTVGWGHLPGGKSSTVLQESQLTVLNNDDCRDRYQEQGKLFSNKQFSKQVLCAGDIFGGRDSCESDSGGPLMQPFTYKDQLNFYQIGIVSYNIPCIRTDVPAVYTSVQHFVDWIQEKVND